MSLFFILHVWILPGVTMCTDILVNMKEQLIKNDSESNVIRDKITLSTSMVYPRDACLYK